jgi:hypothetical protein
MGKIEDLQVINGEGYQLTTLEQAVGLARANSVWPLPFATSCCGIEFMATMGSMYDLSRFGMERMSFTPRQSDLLIVAGTISKKLGPVLKKVWQNLNGFYRLEPVLPPEGFSTHTACSKVLIASFRSMSMFPDVLPDRNKLLME